MSNIITKLLRFSEREALTIQSKRVCEQMPRADARKVLRVLKVSLRGVFDVFSDEKVFLILLRVRLLRV